MAIAGDRRGISGLRGHPRRGAAAGWTRETRRRPVACLLLATFLATLTPIRVAHAEDPKPEPASTSQPQAQTETPPPAPTATAGQQIADVHAAPSTGAVPDGVAKPHAQEPRLESLPVNGNDKTGVSSQAIALPQGAGKVQGMGESFSVQLSTGVANFSVPFALPAARGGAQPSLSLSYNSGGGEGVAGMGWDVGVPFIARQTDRGIPRYQDPPQGTGWVPSQDRFVFNGGQELVPICQVSGTSCPGSLSAQGEVMPCWASGWQYFRPRVEGSFLRFFWSPDHQTWRVQSKSGTTMELGVPLDGSGSANALEVDPNNQSHIFRWDLAREYDAYGGANACSGSPAPVNIVAYQYKPSGGMAYLSDIYDTPPAANPSTAPLSSYAHHTRLNYETRTDITTSYRRGWLITDSLRLTGVDVSSATFGEVTREQVRRYHLSYDTNYHLSLLTSLQMEGRCNTSEDGKGAAGAVAEDGTGALPATTNCPALPAMTFGWQHVQGFHVDGSAQRSDLAGYEPFDERVLPFANSPPHSIDEDVTDLFDINSDGLPDVLVTNPGEFNGNHGVYFNGVKGQANSFAAAVQMPVLGILGDDANSVSLQDLNVSAADINSDGVIDLVHMPQVQQYAVYTPQGSGTSFAWVGRAITTASMQSPKINFGKDGQNIQVADVNGDGLVDVVHSTGTEFETFFSLGRYPNGDGQFGSAQWTGAASALIDNDPVTFCVPYKGLPIQFGDANVRLADMNGDGLQDIVYAQQGTITYWPGRGNGYWGTGNPSACPAGTFGQNTGISMTSSPWYSDPNGSMLRLDDVNGDGLDDLVQIEQNNVEVWLNVDGTSWTAEHVISGSPQAPSYANRVRLTDANGNGTRDILWGDAGAYKYMDLLGGVRPWILTHVQNGLGKTTDLQYSDSTTLMIAAKASGNPWSSVIPNPVHVVTQVTDRDNLNLVGRAAGVYVTQYTYANPVYDGRQREFRGFSSTTQSKVGDANSPTSTTSSTFLLGQCQNDENLSISPCTEEGRWQDNPREALKGLPLVSETYDASGNYLSTAHHTYRLRKLYTGLDGREVRHAFESQSDTFAYDDGPFTPSAQALSLNDVEHELTLGTIQADTTEQVTIRGASYARLHKGGVFTGGSDLTGTSVDVFGNTTAATDDGCVGGCSDDPITTTTTPQLVCSTQTGWLWRTVESYVTSGVCSVPRKDTTVQYDCGGNPTVTTAALSGTLPLQRFYSDGTTQINGQPVQVAPTPATASQDNPAVLVSFKQYDGFGNLTKQTAPNARCREVGYEASFKQLAISETLFVGDAPQPCSGTSLTTVASYDRAFDLVTQVTDLHGEVTLASYDGLARVTGLVKPDPANIGQPTGGAQSPVPSVIVQYALPADPTITPYTLLSTQTQDGWQTQTQNGSTITTPTYRQSYAYVDGFGRTLVTVDQADTTAGDLAPWIADGLVDYDAKGAKRRAYLPWFWNGDPTKFPLGTTPTTGYGSQRYDAFGRQLQTFNLDGSISLQSTYHALSVDKWDAADLSPGPHQGTYASATQDGHGRTTVVTERVHTANGNAIESHNTTTTYLCTGEPEVITRTNSSGGTPVTRWLVYDSLGRMVLNVEPNTTKNFVSAPTGDPLANLSGVIPASMLAWRYAYDLNGDLVGTSDARGCGANYKYDDGGRIEWEDFSPCLATQQPYSAPQSSGDGTEAFYEYDSVPSEAAAIPGCAINPVLTLGRLVEVSDRGARTATGFDGRGRATCVGRLMATPTPSDALADRYTPTWNAQSVVFDIADRPIQTTTGADQTGLLDSTGQSYVTTTYSKRGTVSSVGSGYGALVAGVTRAADGPINQIVYGDLAATTTSFSYDARRRLSTVQTLRGPPSIWSSPPTTYQPPPTPNGPPNTFQLVLENATYSYDAVDNPVEIHDYRSPAEWPAGAQPVSRKVQYDDVYRVTNVAYEYPGGTDGWVDPFNAEDTGLNPDPRRGKPSPHVSFTNRVLNESFQYDWLGNTVQTDDDAHGFYDRSLGTVTNGTASQGPYQLKTAQQVAGSARTGALSTAYDAAGNLTALSVTRAGSCLPMGATCSQQFAYDWDEVGRLVRARRWDQAGAPGATETPSAELLYAYDSSDQRTLKTAVDGSGNHSNDV